MEYTDYKVPNKKIKIDVNVTGAKCLPQMEVQDLKSRYAFCDIVGKVRTKPGRGSPTLSVSCSDKFAKWCHLGFQGSLISLLLSNPIFMKTLIVASKSYDLTALQRALYNRFNRDCLQGLFGGIKQAEIVQLEENFEFCKADDKYPCPCSIIWSKTKYKPFEVAVEGKRQGVTKNKSNTKAARLQICKMELFRCFTNILENKKLELSKTFLKNQTYLAIKLSAKDYQIKWKYLQKNGFKAWTCKNKALEDFKLD
ncbi:tRNA-specific adenosine deaminase 1 [Agrilus planipennis]|uniref:tRNA-specific adenosine deaminase 1 n=1 Tax=Agrilus planipennis TaxID=224129 RepID=A0A1W4WLE5_AGRPL|nr:tRNA-specific adenosine deaminase 1 [Agrilus planipennis]